MKHTPHFLCALFLFLSSAGFAAPPAPTFSREVVRIFQHDCQTCHRPGGLAPFSLMEFKDIAEHAKTIADEVASGDMPPWKPVAGCGDFVDNRSLSTADKETIQHWVANGAPEGDPADLPPVRHFPKDWTLGTPDATLASPVPYPMGADDEDEYRCFVLPWTAPKDDYIVGVEIKPDRSTVVHHAIVYLDPKGNSLAKLNPADPRPGYECFGGPGYEGAISVGGWVPGNTPSYLPSGMGFAVPKDSHVVLQIHYHKDGKPQLDQTQLGLHFAKEPIQKPLTVGAVFDAKNLYIPAGNPAYSITKEIVLPLNIKVISVTPHMHLLGKKISLEAILPDGTNRCMVKIDDWDFHWQGTYTYKNFLDLPMGTRLRMTGEYNNSDSNPDQPNHPVKDVKWGDRTVDEMFLSFFNYVLN